MGKQWRQLQSYEDINRLICRHEQLVSVPGYARGFATLAPLTLCETCASRAVSGEA